MNNDEANTRAWYRFYHTLWSDTVVEDPVLGYPDLFNSVTEEDLRDYYSSRYTPENMVVVVAGDSDAEEMTAKVAEEFGAMEPSAVPLPTVERPEHLPGATAPIAIAPSRRTSICCAGCALASFRTECTPCERRSTWRPPISNYAIR